MVLDRCLLADCKSCNSVMNMNHLFVAHRIGPFSPAKRQNVYFTWTICFAYSKTFQSSSTKCHGASAASENGMRLWGSNCFISEAGTHASCPSPQTIINTCQTFPVFTHPISMKSPSFLFNPAAFLLPLSLDIRLCTLVCLTTTPSNLQAS